MDRPAQYRKLIESTQGSWTPDMIARMPLVQLAALGHRRGGNSQKAVLQTINAARAKKGLPPLLTMPG